MRHGETGRPVQGFPPICRVPALSGYCRYIAGEGQPQPVGRFLKVCDHLRDIHILTRKEIFKSQPLLRCFRVQGESCPGDVHIKFGFQFFNTPGNEITPRSDVVGKDLQPI